MKYLTMAVVFSTATLSVLKLAGLSDIDWTTATSPLWFSLITIVLILGTIFFMAFLRVRNNKKEKPVYKYQTPPPKPVGSPFRRRLEEAKHHYL